MQINEILTKLDELAERIAVLAKKIDKIIAALSG
jgi:uncharacterized small protein (DUF1192 family)